MDAVYTLRELDWWLAVSLFLDVFHVPTKLHDAFMDSIWRDEVQC